MKTRARPARTILQDALHLAPNGPHKSAHGDALGLLIRGRVFVFQFQLSSPALLASSSTLMNLHAISPRPISLVATRPFFA